MNDNLPENQRLERLAGLRKRREEILSLPPETALSKIMAEKQPAALVHSFPEQDFYFLIHDIGLGDALPLLALASDRQREYVLDMEGWHRDRLNVPAMTGWLSAMLMADPDRVTSWLLKDQTGLLELLLFRNIQVVLREHDQDPSSFGDEFFTHDDIYYLRILDDPLLEPSEALASDSTEKIMDDQRRGFFQKLLARLADLHHAAYQKILLEAASLMPAEMEEEVYRLRNVRMAEKGFLPFEEAVGIYQPISPEALGSQPAKTFGRGEEDDEALMAPLYPVKLLRQGMPFSDALQEIDTPFLLQRIQTEFVSLCNQVIAADQQKIQAKEALQTVVEKVCGYLNIGLEASSSEHAAAKGKKAAAMASLIERLPLSQIFRFGYGRALSLKWRVARWRKTAWYEKAGLPLTFWGESWLGVLGGLMVEKPLYFDNYRTGRGLYREFKSLEEIEATGQVLSNIMAVDELLAGMGIRCEKDPGYLLTWQNLILTLWVRAYSGVEEAGDFNTQGRLTPIPKKEFKAFFKMLFAPGKTQDEPWFRTTKTMKTSFLTWLSGRSGVSAEEITGRLGGVLDELFDRVDEELGALQPDDIDPRYIHLFRVG